MYKQPPDLSKILPEPYTWCSIVGGRVTLEDASQMMPNPGTQGGNFLVEPFFISKYLITNAQYQVFLEDGGYHPKWWSFSDAARAWRTATPEAIKTGYAGDWLPRTNVSWYDAVAFCHWLSEKTGREIRLPGEAQWQRAAIGDQNWRYPYGMTFQVRRANTDQSRITVPTPVDRYPEGASPFGVLDMSGNVFEWCLTEWATGKDTLEGNRNRAMRGGSFYHNEFAAQSTARSERDPGNWKYYLGFRIVCM